MIIYEADPEDEYQLEQVLLNAELELISYQLSLAYDEARELHGDDISLIPDEAQLNEISQAITNLQKHLFYNEKPKLIK